MNNNENNYNEQPAYQAYMEVKSRSRGFAVASLVLGILSLVCCCIPFFGLVSAVIAVIFATVSKVKMGYFDPLALAGLILGIIGVVFGATVLILFMLTKVGVFNEFLEEYLRVLEEMYGSTPPSGEL